MLTWPVSPIIFTEYGTEQEAIRGSLAVRPGEISSLGSCAHLQEEGAEAALKNYAGLTFID